MLTKRFVLMILLTVFFGGTMPLRAQDAGALLDLLVRKKLITPQDAAEVRAEMAKESKAKTASLSTSSDVPSSPVPVTSKSANKWKLSSPITELELYGDV